MTGLSLRVGQLPIRAYGVPNSPSLRLVLFDDWVLSIWLETRQSPGSHGRALLSKNYGFLQRFLVRFGFSEPNLHSMSRECILEEA